MKKILPMVLAMLLTGCATNGELASARRCGTGILGGLFEFALNIDIPFMSTGTLVGVNSTLPAIDCVNALGVKPSTGPSASSSNVSVDK